MNISNNPNPMQDPQQKSALTTDRAIKGYISAFFEKIGAIFGKLVPSFLDLRDRNVKSLSDSSASAATTAQPEADNQSVVAPNPPEVQTQEADQQASFAATTSQTNQANAPRYKQIAVDCGEGTQCVIVPRVVTEFARIKCINEDGTLLPDIEKGLKDFFHKTSRENPKAREGKISFCIGNGQILTATFRKGREGYAVQGPKVGSVSSPQSIAVFEQKKPRDLKFNLLYGTNQKKSLDALLSTVQDPAYSEKVNVIIASIGNDPYGDVSGDEHTEKLKNEYKEVNGKSMEVWTKRINQENRVAYTINKGTHTATIFHVWGHYPPKTK